MLKYYNTVFDPYYFSESYTGNYIKTITTTFYEVLMYSPWELFMMISCLHYEFKRDKRTSIKSTLKFIIGVFYSKGLWIFISSLWLTLLEKSLKNILELTIVILLRNDFWDNEGTVSLFNYSLQWLLVSGFKYARLVLLFNSGKINPCPWTLSSFSSAPVPTEGKGKKHLRKSTSKTLATAPRITYTSMCKFILGNYTLVLIAGAIDILRSLAEDTFVSYGIKYINRIDSNNLETLVKSLFTVIGFTVLHPFHVLEYKVIIGQRFQTLNSSNSPSKVLNIIQILLKDPIMSNLSGINITMGTSLFSLLGTVLLNALASKAAAKQMNYQQM